MLPKGGGAGKIDINDKILLEYYRLKKDFEGSIELESTGWWLYSYFGGSWAP